MTQPSAMMVGRSIPIIQGHDMRKVHKKKELEDFFQKKENYNLVRPDRLADVDGLLSGETYSEIGLKKGLSRERIRQRLSKEMSVIDYRQRIRKEMKVIKRRMNQSSCRHKRSDMFDKQDDNADQETTPIMAEWWHVLELSIRSVNFLQKFATYDRSLSYKRVMQDKPVTYEEFRRKLEAEGILFLLGLPNCERRCADEIIGAVKKFESRYMP
jgi:hypothetical protein